MKQLFIFTLLMVLSVPYTWGQCTISCNSTQENTFIGILTPSASISGTDNVAIGQAAGRFLTTGSDNTAIGRSAGINLGASSRNTIIGNLAGRSSSIGSGNVFIGNQAGEFADVSNQLYIDNSNTSSPLIWGNFATNELNVNGELGINNRTPAFPLEINDDATVGIQYNGRQDGTFFAGAYMNGARPFYGYKQNGVINAYHYLETDGTFKLWLNGRNRMTLDPNGQLGIGIETPERPIHLRATNAIFRIDRDRDDPGFAVVRYDQGFQNVWKSFYFYTRGFGPNNGKFIIADWQQNVAGPSTARLVIANGGNVGIGDFLFSNPSQKLTVAGNAQANAFFTTSDKRFKENIQPISEVMANLENVNGVSYAFRKQEEALEKRNLPAGRSMGLLAQEVQQVYPELVAEDEEGYLSINYDGFIPVLIEAVKEQQGQINNQDELIKNQSDLIARQQAQLKSQGDRMSRLESQVQELLSSAPGNTISPNNAAQLYQNQPNPFGENTKISFFLPESTQEAVLLVYDLQGKQIKEIRIRQRGEGEVALQSGSLEAGMYFYALVADGQEVDMKRMLIRE